MRQFFAGNFHAGQRAVMTDADAREAERVQSVLGLLDLSKCFGCDLAAVLDARGQACGGWLVPEAQASGAGEGANLGLGELRLGQRRARGVERGGLLAGTEVAAIIEVHAVGEVGVAELLAQRFHLREQLLLAVEAALGIVARVIGVAEFDCGEDANRDSVLVREVKRCGQFCARQRGGIRQNGEHAVTEDAVRSPGEESGIGATGVGDEQAVQTGKNAIQLGAFGVEFHVLMVSQA